MFFLMTLDVLVLIVICPYPENFDRKDPEGRPPENCCQVVVWF